MWSLSGNITRRFLRAAVLRLKNLYFPSCDGFLPSNRRRIPLQFQLKDEHAFNGHFDFGTMKMSAYILQNKPYCPLSLRVLIRTCGIIVIRIHHIRSINWMDWVDGFLGQCDWGERRFSYICKVRFWSCMENYFYYRFYNLSFRTYSYYLQWNYSLE